MPSVCLKTFGCKLNQAETGMISLQFQERGYRIVPSTETSCDVMVVNTCTVTGRSDAKCRRVIRHALRENPNVTIVVTGCMAQVDADTVSKLAGVDYVLGVDEKHRIFDFFHSPGKRAVPLISVSPVTGLKQARSQASDNPTRTRAYLKIQDGCSNRCAYCIVPIARGPSRSVPMSNVLKQAEQLVRDGYKEIVLTGVHIGMYGKEKDGRSALPELLRQLIPVIPDGRIRLSSLDPEDLTDELIETIAETDRVCRHFHIPLQSGSDAMLTVMDRMTTIQAFRSKIDVLVRTFGQIGLGTDVIVGFPGESDIHFRETEQLIHELPFSYLHVFPYSIRPGTQAAAMSGHLPSRVRVMRARCLRELGHQKHNIFFRAWLGREVNVLVENVRKDGCAEGLTSEYLRVVIPKAFGEPNRFVRTVITSLDDEHIIGQICDATQST